VTGIDSIGKQHLHVLVLNGLVVLRYCWQ